MTARERADLAPGDVVSILWAGDRVKRARFCRWSVWGTPVVQLEYVDVDGSKWWGGSRTDFAAESLVARDRVMEEWRNVYLWRAWSARRERICDCGTAIASSVDEAKRIAGMTLGGPHMLSVVEFDVELVCKYVAPTMVDKWIAIITRTGA